MSQEGDKTIITTDKNVVEMVEQPKPKFTIIDLETTLSAIFKRTLNFTAYHKSFIDDIQSPEEETLRDGLVEANSMLQELIAKVDKIKNDLEVIDMPSDNNQAILTELNTEKVAFHVAGVQLFENGKCVGTSLYSTVVKARKIRDILNAKFAELKVNHEAKILNYPVY